MTLSERYRLKLERFRLHQERLLANKLERQNAAMLRRKQEQDRKQKAGFRNGRLQLLRLQCYKCAICRKHRDECGKRGLIADCFAAQVVRGLICANCNNLLEYYKDDRFAIASSDHIPYKIRKNAVSYLEHWPSQRLEAVLYRHKQNPELP